MKNKVSPELEAHAIKVAKGTQKAGQTKAQTKLIAQGIEKGIAEYKKQHAKKLRELDKKRKQQMKQAEHNTASNIPQEASTSKRPLSMLPWALLLLSWLGFIVYFFALI